MCSWNKIINTLKHSRGNINPFTTFKPTGWKWLKKLELLSATPRATLTHLSCSPNFPCASYLDERMLTYEPIVLFVSCAFIKIWSPCKVLRVLKKLEMLSAAPRATLTRIICSPNFPRAGVKLDQFPDLIYWRPLVGRKQRRRFKRRKQLERFNFSNISFF